MANTNAKKPHSLALRLIYAVALIFLCIGLCVLGSFRGTGDAYELKVKGSSDAKTPTVVFSLSNPTETGEDGSASTVYLRVTGVYINVGAAYLDRGEAATVKVQMVTDAASTSTTSSNRLTYEFSNFTAPESGEGEASAQLPAGDYYNWVQLTRASTSSSTTQNGWRVATYDYAQLTVTGGNVLINEVVFIGERLSGSSSSAEGTGEFFVVPAAVHSATQLLNETEDEARERACALVDRQYQPSASTAHFFRYTDAEKISMMTIAEIRAGGSYGEGNVYEGERVYGAFGVDILALGTLIFGMSPFGLRFFPMLAAAGALLVGALFVRRLAGSDRAGLVFAVLFALASATLALGGLGTPLMLGVFFLLLSLDMCHRFYANGMKGANFLSALPLLVSGLSGALAILVHGAFILPVAGVAALFAAGLVRQQRARRYHLDRAIAEAEAEPVQEPVQELSPARQNVAHVAREYANKTAIACISFGCALILGAVVLSLLFALPMYYPYIKMYSDPAAPTLNIFTLAAMSFAGGFTGSNVTAPLSGAWNIFYLLSRTNGGTFSVVYGAFLNPVAILAVLAGVAFLVYNVVRLVRILRAGAWGKEARSLLRRAAIPFAGLVLCLVAAAVAADAVVFVLLGWLFLFMFAADAAGDFTAREGKLGTACRIAVWTGFALLAAMFALYFVFAAGLPVASGIITAVFG